MFNESNLKKFRERKNMNLMVKNFHTPEEFGLISIHSMNKHRSKKISVHKSGQELKERGGSLMQYVDIWSEKEGGQGPLCPP